MTIALTAGEYGQGKPVGILHGLFGAARNWAAIARHLAQRHRVIAFDLRNHGTSPWADTMDYPEMAEDVRVAMRARAQRLCADRPQHGRQSGDDSGAHRPRRDRAT